LPSVEWKTKKGIEYAPLVKRYKTEFPYMDNAKLAKMIIKREKINHTVDVLRTIIPYTGGKQTSVSLDDTEFVIEIPDSLYKERPRFIIPAGIDRLLYISDLHIPYHDITAIKLAIKYGYDNGMRGIFLGGDIIDFYGVSRYQRLPHLRRVKEEIDSTRQFLENLRNKFPDLEIYYKIGNHEQRWINYLINVAPELFDLDSVQIDDVLHLTRLRIKMIDSLTVSEFGRLNIIHGHEILGGGVHVARNFRIKASDNILFGHFHRTQENLTRTIKNKVLGSWAVGSLCGLSPDYMSINDWNLGFAFLTREKDGNFTVENKKIINGYIY